MYENFGFFEFLLELVQVGYKSMEIFILSEK